MATLHCLAKLAALWLAMGGHMLFGQAILCPNQIKGSIEFCNAPQGPVINFVNSVGGFYSGGVLANSLPPAPPSSASSAISLPPSGYPASYELTVDTDCTGNAGYDYRVTPYIQLRSGGYFSQYHFVPKTSGPVFKEQAPDVVLNFCECAGLVRVKFVDANGRTWTKP